MKHRHSAAGSLAGKHISAKRGSVRVTDIRKRLRELPDKHDDVVMGIELDGSKIVDAYTLTSKVESDNKVRNSTG